MLLAERQNLWTITTFFKSALRQSRKPFIGFIGVLGYSSVQTTQRCLGCKQNLANPGE